MADQFVTPIMHFPNAQEAFNIPQTAQANAFLGDIYGTYGIPSIPSRISPISNTFQHALVV